MTSRQVVQQAAETVQRDLGDGRWLEHWPDGAPHVLGLLAQDVQEAVHERDRGWPPCPEPTCDLRGQHCLVVEPDLGSDPFWTCDRTGLPVAPIGWLRG